MNSKSNRRSLQRRAQFDMEGHIASCSNCVYHEHPSLSPPCYLEVHVEAICFVLMLAELKGLVTIPRKACRSVTHCEPKHLLGQHTDKWSSTSCDCSFEASVEGIDHVAQVWRHNLCKDWVIACGRCPGLQNPHAHQSPSIKGDRAWFPILWQTLWKAKAE